MSRTTEPTRIAQGERIEWTKSYSGFSAQEYDLQYRIRGNGPGRDIDATADDTGFVAEITAAQSALFSIGRYQWQAWLTEQADAANTFQVGEGRLDVVRGFVADETGDIDMRSTAKQILDALDAAILGTATSTQLEYEISTPAGSRRVKRMTYSELKEARKIYAGIVSRENAAERVRNGGRFGTQVLVNVRES
ncbi:MAG TPA: hypothetical protein VJL58_04785 [Pyrinomonadaceae bacterium]|nr:hypothetical protein [Pyrinomonadaceae bacterium]